MFFQNAIHALIAIPYSLVAYFPHRLLELLQHLFVRPFQLVNRASFNFQKYRPSWILLFVNWLIQVILKALDLLSIWEVYDFVNQLIKYKSRKLSPYELEQAKKVFGNSIDYWRIHINEGSWWAKIGAKRISKPHLGFVLFHTVHFSRTINCQDSTKDMAWLIHELVHISQMEQMGSSYIIEALYAQKKWGYKYCQPEELSQWKLAQFNLEQQADIARHYWLFLHKKDSREGHYRDCIMDLKNKNF